MAQCWLTWYVTLPVFVLLVEMSYANTIPSCTMPTTPEGKSTALTCLFKENLKEMRERPDIIIQHKAVNADKPEDIMECLSYENHTSDYKCTVDNRFYFNYEITDTLQLELRHAEKKSEGKYICQAVRYSRSVCEFHLGPSAGESGIHARWTAVIAALTFSLHMI